MLKLSPTKLLVFFFFGFLGDLAFLPVSWFRGMGLMFREAPDLNYFFWKRLSCEALRAFKSMGSGLSARLSFVIEPWRLGFFFSKEPLLLASTKFW